MKEIVLVLASYAEIKKILFFLSSFKEDFAKLIYVDFTKSEILNIYIFD